MRDFRAASFRRQRQRPPALLLVALAALLLSACSGSDDDLPSTESPTTESSTSETPVSEESELAIFAADVLGTTPSELSLGQVYEIAGTNCQAQVLGVEGEPAEGARHFVLAPDREIIAGGEPNAVGSALRSCYDAAGLEITPEQFVELILNLGPTSRTITEIDASYTAVFRDAELEYQPPLLERNGDDLTFTFWALGTEFADLIEVTAERSAGSDLTVTYEILDEAP